MTFKGDCRPGRACAGGLAVEVSPHLLLLNRNHTANRHRSKIAPSKVEAAMVRRGDNRALTAHFGSVNLCKLYTLFLFLGEGAR
jgi:hypothetical protein